MTAAALKSHAGPTIERADPSLPIIAVTGAGAIAIRAGTVLVLDSLRIAFEVETPVELPALTSGQDYFLRLAETGGPFVSAEGLDADDTFGGFHYAPGGNAAAREGGDAVPAINPFSCWDIGFRPACPDPRGMTLVTMPGGARFWADIYLLGADHRSIGTSRCGVTIADGKSLPDRPAGKGRCPNLDYQAAVDIYAAHGKRLLGAEEFFVAAHGVKERASRDADPKVTGDVTDPRFTSRFGLFDATGSMWQWGTDGDPDNPRASLFGGAWVSGADAGSRCAVLDYWPGASSGSFSARGRSDHLSPA